MQVVASLIKCMAFTVILHVCSFPLKLDIIFHEQVITSYYFSTQVFSICEQLAHQDVLQETIFWYICFYFRLSSDLLALIRKLYIWELCLLCKCSYRWIEICWSETFVAPFSLNCGFEALLSDAMSSGLWALMYPCMYFLVCRCGNECHKSHYQGPRGALGFGFSLIALTLKVAITLRLCCYGNMEDFNS